MEKNKIRDRIKKNYIKFKINNFKFNHHFIIMNNKSFTYKKSGVDINVADKFVKFISNITSKKKKFNNIGGFGSIYDLPEF